jgi:hypothetical protein
LASASNLWTGKLLLLKSFTPKSLTSNTTSSGDDYVQAVNLTHNGTHWVVQWQHEYVGKNYNAEVGYVPRVGYFKIDPDISYLLYPKVLQVRYLYTTVGRICQLLEYQQQTNRLHKYFRLCDSNEK